MHVKANVSEAWFRWHGVFLVTLMFGTGIMNLSPLAAGVVVGLGNLAVAGIFTPKAQRRVWVWVLSSIGVAVMTALSRSNLGRG
jgi:hypothetical protein